MNTVTSVIGHVHKSGPGLRDISLCQPGRGDPTADDPWLTVSKKQWKDLGGDWPPKVGDVVSVAVPQVVEIVVGKKGGPS